MKNKFPKKMTLAEAEEWLCRTIAELNADDKYKNLSQYAAYYILSENYALVSKGGAVLFRFRDFAGSNDRAEKVSTDFRLLEKALAEEGGTTQPEEKNFDWSAMPAWINWLARDKSGFWMGYTNRPEREHIFWHVPGTYSADSMPNCCDVPNHYAPPGYEDCDWKETLIQRPKN